MNRKIDRMIQKYLLTLEGDKLPNDISKDIAQELDCSFLYEGRLPYRIRVEKIMSNKL